MNISSFLFIFNIFLSFFFFFNDTATTEIYTLSLHDALPIGLGEDGPTHQPIEHLATLRLIPGMSLWRPCDAAQSAVEWKAAIERKGPTALVFSRQNLPHQVRSEDQLKLIARGGYVLAEASNGKPEAIIIA